MKIRILGFEPDYSLLPSPVPAISGFRWLEGHPGYQFSSVLISAVTPIENWLVGVVIKTRDARTLTKMRQDGGTSRIRAERLPDNEKLTEINFFLVHPATARGLYAHHHASSSLTYDFGRVCAKSFNIRRKEVMEEAILSLGLKGKHAVAKRKEYAGQFSLSKVLSRGQLKDFLKEMKRASSFESTFTSFDLEESVFDPLSKLARRKTVKFQFPPDLAINLVSDDIVDAVDSGSLDDFKVSAYDQAGELASFRSSKNFLVFDECDYDDLLGGVDIDFSDWAGSITQASAAKRLVALAKTVRIGKILGAA